MSFFDQMPWEFIVVFLVLGALVPWRGAVRIRQMLSQPFVSSVERLTAYASTIAFQWFLSAIVLWRCIVRGVSLSDLALSLATPAQIAAISVVLALAIGGLQYAAIRGTARQTGMPRTRLVEISLRLMPQSQMESFVFCALAATAAVCEEFLYRGFVFAVLQRFSDSWFLPLFGSSLLFALAHSYQGRRGIISTFVLGLIFAGARIWTGSLLPAVAVHLVVDLLAGLVAPGYLQKMVAAGGAPAGSE